MLLKLNEAVFFRTNGTQFLINFLNVPFCYLKLENENFWHSDINPSLSAYWLSSFSKSLQPLEVFWILEQSNFSRLLWHKNLQRYCASWFIVSLNTFYVVEVRANVDHESSENIENIPVYTENMVFRTESVFEGSDQSELQAMIISEWNLIKSFKKNHRVVFRWQLFDFVKKVVLQVAAFGFYHLSKITTSEQTLDFVALWIVTSQFLSVDGCMESPTGFLRNMSLIGKFLYYCYFWVYQHDMVPM